MAREPKQARKGSVRGAAQAVECRARGIRFVRHFCLLGIDAHRLARYASIADRSNGDPR